MMYTNIDFYQEYPVKNFITHKFLTKRGLFMYNQNGMGKLQQQLCELKLEERQIGRAHV